MRAMRLAVILPKNRRRSSFSKRFGQNNTMASHQQKRHKQETRVTVGQRTLLMRELGTASDRSSAQVFVDYLLTQKIPAAIRDDAGIPAIWVHNEDDVERAKIIWNEFQQNPNDSKYDASR